MKYTVFTFSIVFVFLSCRSYYEHPLSIPTRSTKNIIDKYLTEHDYVSLFLLARDFTRYDIPKNQRYLLYERALSILKNQLADALQKKQYLLALNILHNAHYLSVELHDFDYLSQEELQRKMVMHLITDQKINMAFYILRSLPLHIFSDNQLIYLLKQAKKWNRSADFSYLRLEVEKRVIYPSEEFQKKSANQNLDEDSNIIERTKNAVVRVFTTDVHSVPITWGSGFFIEKYYILTSYHVIEGIVNGKNEQEVKLYVKTPELIPAKVLSYDRLFNIALLSVTVAAPQQVSFSYQRVSLGQHIYVVGTIREESFQTITSGIISTVQRENLQSMGYLLQIDAAVQDNNSGAVVFNEHGEVVGMLLSTLEDLEGISFVLPGKWILQLLPLLFRYSGQIHYPWIGGWGEGSDEGIIVNYVASESPAKLSQLQKEDIICALDGKKVKKIFGLQFLLLAYQEGSVHNLKIKRGKNILEKLIVVQNRPEFPILKELKHHSIRTLFRMLLGIETKVIKIRKHLQELEVTSVLEGGASAALQFSVGDIVYVIDWKINRSTKDIFFSLQTRRKFDSYIRKLISLSASYPITNFF